MAVELALTPDGRWDHDIVVVVEAAAAAGFSGLGLSAGRADKQAAQAYRDAGMRCHELLALSLACDAKTEARAEDLARAAAVVEAEWILTVFRSGLDRDTAALIKRCAAIFAAAGARMAVEFSPLGPVDSIAAGLEVVAAAGHDRAGLVIDSWHFAFAGSDWEELERVPLERIAYVQFTDAAEPGSDDLMEETMERRLMPGEGMLDLSRFSSILLDRGWQGLVSTEVLNRELRELPLPDYMRRAHAASERYWS